MSFTVTLRPSTSKHSLHEKDSRQHPQHIIIETPWDSTDGFPISPNSSHAHLKRPDLRGSSTGGGIRVGNATPFTQFDEEDQHERELREYYTLYPNRWAYYRTKYMRLAMSEFLGTMILIIFGAGVDCQVSLSANTSISPSPKGDYLQIAFGWAIGAGLGAWVASHSGGHINPAVTLVQAVFRGLPWKLVPVYIISQILGATFGALLIYANYFHAIDILEGGTSIRTQQTASYFTTFALDFLPNVACFFSEFLATAVLLIVILSVTDKSNGPPPNGMVPLVVFLVILGEGIALGMETSYAINPARDLGPRLALFMVGYPKSVLWGFRHQYWLWVAQVAPYTGAFVGALVYDAFLFTGSESFVNRRNADARRYHAYPAPRQRPVIGRGTQLV